MSDDWQARLFASSIGSIVAECVTLPTDVAKVRLQIQKIEVGGSARYDGLAQGCVKRSLPRKDLERFGKD